ncbi:pentapeptide repeat-containing protein [Desulforhopalus vacuolatus]|uniref:pentapeptide repeat-containing protein n=1 Tax=Desulforhopalus vacuolatus TaxID=40414 RepID=UPI0019660732|nr:pentapeptide repeat-containing protein [Desulforhopalus vacuolatus]MBM9519949.1 pentapeptide repeat-containing protein [Desulforhopalus vacuolatus]
MKKRTVIIVSALFLGFSDPVASSAASAAARENLQILLETRTCQNCDLSGLDLNRLDLSGVNLQGADLSLSSCKLTNLSEANLSKAKLNGVSFDGADLGEADLRGADLRGVRMDSAYLDGAKISGKIVEQNQRDRDGNVTGPRDVVKEDDAKSKRHPVAGQANLAPSHLDSGVAALQSSQAKHTQDMAKAGKSSPVKSPMTAPVAAITVAPEEKKRNAPDSLSEADMVPAKPPLIRAIQKKVKKFSDTMELSEDGKLTIHAVKKKKFAEDSAGNDDSTEALASLTRQQLKNVEGGYEETRMVSVSLGSEEDEREIEGGDRGGESHFNGEGRKTPSLGTSQNDSSRLSVDPVNSPAAFTGSAAPKAKSLRAVHEVPEVQEIEFSSPNKTELQVKLTATTETARKVAAKKETVKTTVPFVQQGTSSVTEMTSSPAAGKVQTLPEEVKVAQADKAKKLPASEKFSSKKKAQLERFKHENTCYACDLAGIDFSGENLENADLEGADLSGCNFSKADLERANLKAANLRGANLRDTNLQDADFYKADLTGADLSGSKVKGASFDGASLQGTLGIKKKKAKK